MSKITIDGNEYELDDLSNDVKVQLGNLQFTDGELARLQAQLALAQTARNTYVRALKEALDAQNAATKGN